MKNVAQKGTKVNSECVKGSTSPLVAANVSRRIPFDHAGWLLVHSRLRRSQDRRLTSAATGRLAASWLCDENAPGVANSICNSLIFMIFPHIFRCFEAISEDFHVSVLRFFAAIPLASCTLFANDILI